MKHYFLSFFTRGSTGFTEHRYIDSRVSWAGISNEENAKRSIKFKRTQTEGVGQYFSRRASPLDVLMHVGYNLTANLLHSLSHFLPCLSLLAPSGLFLYAYPFKPRVLFLFLLVSHFCRSTHVTLTSYFFNLFFSTPTFHLLYFILPAG